MGLGLRTAQHLWGAVLGSFSAICPAACARLMGLHSGLFTLGTALQHSSRVAVQAVLHPVLHGKVYGGVCLLRACS